MQPVKPTLRNSSRELEHIHIAIVQKHFLEGVCAGETSTNVAEVDHEDLTLAPVVVELVEDDGGAARRVPQQ